MCIRDSQVNKEWIDEYLNEAHSRGLISVRCHCKDVYKRQAYDKTIKELEQPLMKTFIPDTKRYKKELVADREAVFRSTLFPASRPLVRGKMCIRDRVYRMKYKEKRFTLFSCIGLFIGIG